MIPTMFTSSFYFFQGPRRVYSAAVVGTIASIAPVLGPVIGGWITDTWNWHWLFYVNLVPGIAVTILAALLIRIDEPDWTLLKDADYPGIVLMAVALGTLEYVLEEGARWNWFDDATIRHCAWIAGIAGVLFVIRSLTFARPVVDLRALKNRNFAVGCFLSFVTGIGIFSTIYLTPLFLGYVRGLQRLADRARDLLDRRRLARRGARLYHAGAQDRHALADDVRPRPVWRCRCGPSATSPAIGAAANCWSRRCCAASRRSSQWRRR